MRTMPINDPKVTKTPVGGIGDQANYGTTVGQVATMAVKKGDVYFTIEVKGFPLGQLQGIETTLAKAAAAKL